MKVAVVGASGFVGAHLVADLLSSKYEVLVLGRQKPSNFIGSDVRFIFCDLLDFQIEMLASEIGKVDFLINCAGETNDQEKMFKVNTLGAKNLFELARNIGAKFIQLGSIGVYGESSVNLITETTRCQPVTEYERTKLYADLALLDAASGNFDNLIILRPTSIFGAGMRNRSMFDLIRIIDLRAFFFIGNKHATANYLHIKDLSNAIIATLEKRKSKNVIYNISNQISFVDLVNIISLFLGKRKPRVRVPIRFALLASWVLELLGIKILTKTRIENLSKCRAFSSARFSYEFGWEPKIPYDQAIDEMVETYLNERRIGK